MLFSIDFRVVSIPVESISRLHRINKTCSMWVTGPIYSHIHLTHLITSKTEQHQQQAN